MMTDMITLSMVSFVRLSKIRIDSHEDISRLSDFSSRQHGDALPKAKACSGKHDEVLDREHAGEQQVFLVAKAMRFVQILIKLSDQSRTQSKGMDSASARQNALCERATLGVDFENTCLQSSFDHRADPHHNDGRWSNSDAYE